MAQLEVHPSCEGSERPFLELKPGDPHGQMAMTWAYQLPAHFPRAEGVVPEVVGAVVVEVEVLHLLEAGEAAVVGEVLHHPEAGEAGEVVVVVVGVQGQNHSVEEAAVQTEALFCQVEAEQVLSDGPRGAVAVVVAQMERLR